ncbi:MAG: GTPase Era [Rubrivivax sp.]|nr:GTPase Era [Rubrivivax sp.]
MHGAHARAGRARRGPLAPRRRAGSRPPHAGRAEGDRPPRRAAAVVSTEPAAAPPQRCGLVAIVGRPNVGKSTLLNALVGQKISITSKKAQTTRHRITGVRTVGASQFVFVDTPGFQTRQQKALNRTLNRTVHAALADVDVVLFVCEAGHFTLDDAKVLALLQDEGVKGKPAILLANKLDTLARRQDVLPWLKQMQQRHPFAEYVPMSARRAADVERLFAVVEPYLPEQPWQHDEEALTDRNERFLASEIVREKLFRLTGDELPYTSTVVIDQFEEEGAEAAPVAPTAAAGEPPAGAKGALPVPPARRVRIAASIVVEREAHKGMVIGEGGERLKRIGTEARQELQKLLDARVHLELWVKVRSGWADDEAHLRSYGYD